MDYVILVKNLVVLVQVVLEQSVMYVEMGIKIIYILWMDIVWVVFN